MGVTITPGMSFLVYKTLGSDRYCITAGVGPELAPYTASNSSSGCFLQLPTFSSPAVAAGEEKAGSAGLYRVETDAELILV